jgi:hypothetical protein
VHTVVVATTSRQQGTSCCLAPSGDTSSHSGLGKSKSPALMCANMTEVFSS